MAAEIWGCDSIPDPWHDPIGVYFIVPLFFYPSLAPLFPLITSPWVGRPPFTIWISAYLLEKVRRFDPTRGHNLKALLFHIFYPFLSF
jgi:hypothetical protein